MANKQGAQGIDKLGAFLKTSEGRELLASLTAGKGGDAIKTAAEAAISGDTKTAKEALTPLLQTPEGAKLVMTLISLFK